MMNPLSFLKLQALRFWRIGQGLQIGLLSIWLLSCAEFDPTLSQANETELDEDQISDASIETFETSSYKEEVLKWGIVSSTAEIFQTQQRNYLEDVQMTYYDIDRNPTAFVIADTAIMETDTQNIQLMTNVTIRNTKGTKIRGELFYWDDTREELTSPLRVTMIKADGFVVHGTGFVSDKNFENIYFESQVSGNVKEGANEQEAFFNLE